MLLGGFMAFFVWNLISPSDRLVDESAKSVIVTTHGATIFVLSACAALLWHPPRCPHRIRLLELLVFGTPAAFFAVLQYWRYYGDLKLEVPFEPPAFWFLLLFTYALFIPNSVRRAAVVILPIALLPVLELACLLIVNEDGCWRCNSDDFVRFLLAMGLAAVAALYGTHLITGLRREAFEAQQLGQYRLGRMIGRGGMGAVYLGEHLMLKRECAIKVIRPEQVTDPTALARFEREVQAMARLTHGNTVEVYDYGRTDDGTFYYVMEYLPGLSLADLVERYGPLPPGRAVHFLRQACAALEEAHSVGFLHRDIKPGNLFAAERGGVHDVLKLLDFGLVKTIQNNDSVKLTQVGLVAGTPDYMSPEQATGEPRLDARSDLYAVGAVGYFLLTGRPPFVRDSAMAVLVAHARDPLNPPSEARPDLPRDLEAVLLRCLAKKPADRFASAEALEQALAECACANEWSSRLAARWWQDHDTRPHESGGDAPTVARPVSMLAGNV
jgi:serine/threonine-protein kinase